MIKKSFFLMACFLASTIFMGCDADLKVEEEEEIEEDEEVIEEVPLGVNDISVAEQTLLVNAFVEAYNTFLTTDKLPSSITVNEKPYPKNKWFEVACRLLLNISAEKSEVITLSNYASCDNVNNLRLDTFAEDEVGIELLTNQARRQLAYASTGAGNRFANYVGYPNSNTDYPENVTSFSGYLSYDRALISMMRAFAAYNAGGAFPAIISSWQSDFLRSTSNCLVGGSYATSVMNTAIVGKATAEEKARAIFAHWLSIRSYEYYYNTTHGSEKALELRVGNCCDLTHALIAMTRTAGIPSRYVHGRVQFSSGEDGHVWAEFHINGKWVTCDPSNRSNTFGNHENWSRLNTLNSKLAELYF